MCASSAGAHARSNRPKAALLMLHRVLCLKINTGRSREASSIASSWSRSVRRVHFISPRNCSQMLLQRSSLLRVAKTEPDLQRSMLEQTIGAKGNERLNSQVEPKAKSRAAGTQEGKTGVLRFRRVTDLRDEDSSRRHKRCCARLIHVHAAKAAVSVRKRASPNETARKPSLRRWSASSDVKSPSGPINKSTSFEGT